MRLARRSPLLRAGLFLAICVFILVAALAANAQSSSTRSLGPADFVVDSSVGHASQSVNAPTAASTIENWALTTYVNAPVGTVYGTAVWTGQEMIVWGGSGPNGIYNTGGRYNPSTDTWTATATTGAPEARFRHVAVWTGHEMLIWGGTAVPNSLNTGGRYNPLTDSWRPMTTTNAPSGNGFPTQAIWTGKEMMVWDTTGAGGLYDPVADRWRAINPVGAPPTVGWFGDIPALVLAWDGRDAIVFYSLVESQETSGARYNPDTDTWQPISLIDAPLVQSDPAVVWTGQEMIIYGGIRRGSGQTAIYAGARYNPKTDQWTPIYNSSLVATTQAVWTGQEVIFFGVGQFDAANGLRAAKYDPTSNVWYNLSYRACQPGQMSFGRSVWTGNEILTWGTEGCDDIRYNLPTLRFRPSNQPTVQLGVASDTYVALGVPNNAFGTDPYMFIGYDPQYGYLTERIHAYFPLAIPARASVVSAQVNMYMYAYSNGATPMDISVHRATQPTTELSTWNSSGNNYDPAATSVIQVGKTFRWYAWDVTTIAQGWAHGTMPNYGLLFLGNSNGGRNERIFLAREAGGATAPYLSVTYTDPFYASDTTPPTASLATLPALQPTQSPLSIKWSGTDRGRGVQSFDVQVNDNRLNVGRLVLMDDGDVCIPHRPKRSHILLPLSCARLCGQCRQLVDNLTLHHLLCRHLTGQVVDQRHAPVDNADLLITPTPIAIQFDPLSGQYFAYLTSSASHQVSANHVNYMPPPIATVDTRVIGSLRSRFATVRQRDSKRQL